MASSHNEAVPEAVPSEAVPEAAPSEAVPEAAPSNDIFPDIEDNKHTAV